MREKILVIDDQSEVRDYLGTVLERAGFDVVKEADGEKALRRFPKEKDAFALAVLDLDLGPGKPDGLAVLKELKKLAPELPVVMLSGKGSSAAVRAAWKAGAADFVEKDTQIEDRLELSLEKTKELVQAVKENKRLRAEVAELRERADRYEQIVLDKYRMVGKSEALKSVFDRARKLAGIPRPVLVRGERGSGKELVAATIHYAGPRAKKAFIAVNCAAFTGSLLESELFGHEKGAFTGADARKLGRFERASGGTLFLDEVGNMPMEFQEKVLRVIEYQEFERLGGSEPIKVDVRIVAATNAPIEDLVAQGKMRADLVDRLAFDTLVVPPLRDRREDVPVLVEHFAAKLLEEVAGLERKAFTPAALKALEAYSWPGNVRQLKSVVERLVYSVPEPAIDVAHLPLEVTAGEKPAITFEDQVSALEKRLVDQALRDARWNQKRAAQLLGLTYDQFRHYYKKYGFKRDGGEDEG
ncbi:MAG TPA: sigma-54 dependent transcriptional regulator [Planctomycetota bacterium]|nr:sigma-54 dependent transcriptional regulator [Planctomycetota bacterium]